MGRTILMPLDGGGDIEVEIDDVGPSRVVTRGSGVAGLERAGQTFEASLEIIGPVARAVIGKLGAIAEGVEEVQMKFGLKFKADANAILASTSGEASIEVQIKWAKPKPAS